MMGSNYDISAYITPEEALRLTIIEISMLDLYHGDDSDSDFMDMMDGLPEEREQAKERDKVKRQRRNQMRRVLNEQRMDILVGALDRVQRLRDNPPPFRPEDIPRERA